MFCLRIHLRLTLKREFVFFISLYDAPKYDIIWTENSNVIDSFISDILKIRASIQPDTTVGTVRFRNQYLKHFYRSNFLLCPF